MTAPGTNIASLPSAVDMDPTMRSGKPMLNKAMPTTMECDSLLLEDEGVSRSAGLTLKSDVREACNPVSEHPYAQGRPCLGNVALLTSMLRSHFHRLFSTDGRSLAFGG